jgi:hypothetical protein
MSGHSVRRMLVIFIRAKAVTQGSLAVIFMLNGQLGKPCQIRNIAILVVKGLFRPTFIALGTVEIMLMLRVLAICKCSESDLQVCCNNECYAHRWSQQGNPILSCRPFGVSQQLFEPIDGSAVSRGVLYL